MPRLRHTLVACLLAASTATMADNAADNTLPLVARASGALYLRAFFGRDIESDLLVDTGSSYVALTRATFRRLEAEHLVEYVRTIHGKTAAGRTLKVKVYSLSRLTLADGCELENIEAVALPGADRDILGLTALRKLGRFTLAFEPPALSYSTCDGVKAIRGLLAATPAGGD